MFVHDSDIRESYCRQSQRMEKRKLNLGERDWEALYESLKISTSSVENSIVSSCESPLLAGKKAVKLACDQRSSLRQRLIRKEASASDSSTAAAEAGHRSASSTSRRCAPSGLGKVLQKRRHDLGLTQRQLAALVRVKAAHIAYLEGGQRRPSLGLLSRIVEVLGLDREKVFALAHPEASMLFKPERQAKISSGKGMAWAEFSRNTALLARNRIKPQELKVLAQVNLLGKISAPRNYLFILNAIRQAVDEE